MLSTSTLRATMSPYHHGNLRAALLDEAERRLGNGDLSLGERARAAGVSHGAPRRHFTDKQALLDALAEEGFERLRAQRRAAFATAEPGLAPPRAPFAPAYIGFATRHAALLELMFAVKHRPGATESL